MLFAYVQIMYITLIHIRKKVHLYNSRSMDTHLPIVYGH